MRQNRRPKWRQTLADDGYANDVEQQVPPEISNETTQEPAEKDMWNPLRKRGLHFLHLNTNILLPKIDELRLIARNSYAAIIGITESKLDKTILDNEVKIDGYELKRSDRNRQRSICLLYQKRYVPQCKRGFLTRFLKYIF